MRALCEKQRCTVHRQRPSSMSRQWDRPSNTWSFVLSLVRLARDPNVNRGDEFAGSRLADVDALGGYKPAAFKCE